MARADGFVLWNHPYRCKFSLKVGYHYVVDFKNLNKPGLVRKHFYTKEIAQVWMDNLYKQPLYRAHMESFVILPYKKIKDLRLSIPVFILTAYWFDETYSRASQYNYPPGLTDRQKLQYRTKVRRRQIYNRKEYNNMDPHEVIDFKPNLLITRYVKYYRDNDLAYSRPVNCYTKIRLALRREKSYYPSEVVMVTNIIRVLDRFYPGHYSRIKVAIKLYKQYRDKINTRILRYRTALYNRGKEPNKYCSNEEAFRELTKRGFIPKKRFDYTSGSTIQSLKYDLVYPTIFGAGEGPDAIGPNVYLEHGKYGLKGHTRVDIKMN